MPNAKRKVYTMPRLRQQNKGTDTGGYRAKELPTMIEQQQQLLKEIEDAIKEIVSGVEYKDEFYKHILDKMVVRDKDNIDVYLNLLPMKWSYTVAKASKKAVASEWNISEASLPISVSSAESSGYGMA